MSGESNRTPVDRRKRVQTLKKLIIMILAISIIVPCVCCVILFVRVQNLKDELGSATERLEELSGVILEQQSLLEQLKENANAEGEGNPPLEDPVQDSEREDEDTELPEQEAGMTGALQEESGHKVYLTFDDGPSAYTDDILDILDQYEVKATFFVVGKEDDDSKEALQQIVDRGHSLGMHSYSHKYREIYRSVDDFEEDFFEIQNYLYEVTGVRSTIYRFPGGSSNTVSSVDMQDFADYLESQDVTFYDWNISSGDGGSVLLPAQDIVENCTKDIESRDTSIVLLHDSGDKSTTVEALPIIIENILALEDTVILPITEETEPVQHIKTKDKE